MHDTRPLRTERPMASENKDDRVIDRVHSPIVRLWNSANQRMRGSFSVVVRVEHSLVLLIGYTVVGAAVAHFVG